MWRDPDGSGRPHPWILELLRSRGTTTIIIVPDGDIQRYDISTAYGARTSRLRNTKRFAGAESAEMHLEDR